MILFIKKNKHILCIAAFAVVVIIYGLAVMARSRRNVVLSEVCTSNVASVEDENGGYPDWLEIYNPTDTDIDLTGFFVNKSADLTKEKFVFPDGTVVAPHSYYLFDPHFSMSAEGCIVNLLDPDDHYVDSVEVPALRYDTTYARDEETGSWSTRMPTPGYENFEGEELDPFISGGVMASVESGFYSGEFDVELSPSNWGRKVYYTTDGTNPKTDGTLYEQPIHIYDRSSEKNVYSMIPEVSEHYMKGETKLPSYDLDKCTVIRAVARDYLGRYTKETVYTYFVGFDSKKAYDGMAVVCISADPNDLYSNENGIMVLGQKYDEFVAAGEPDEYELPAANFTVRGRKAEREADIEIFDATHTKVLATAAGIKIKGLSSRWDVQKSYSIMFRQAYGGNRKEKFGLDGVDFDVHSIALDKCGQDYYTKMKDTIMTACMKDTDCAITDRVPCCLFLNGEYNGFYWLTQRFDADHMATRYGVDKEDVLIQDRDEFPDYSEWNFDNFDREAMLDYYAANIIVSHEGDWPEFNFRLWKTLGDEGSRFGDGKWRPVIFDVNSVSMEKPDFPSLKYMMERFYPFMDISDNEEGFREEFVKRIDAMSADEFEKDKVLAMIDDLYVRLHDQMIMDIRRWSDCSEDEAQKLYDENVGILRDFFQNRWEYLDIQKELYLNGEFTGVSP